MCFKIVFPEKGPLSLFSLESKLRLLSLSPLNNRTVIEIKSRFQIPGRLGGFEQNNNCLGIANKETNTKSEVRQFHFAILGEPHEIRS